MKTIEKNNNLLNIAKILRRNMTKQEKHLWYDFLRRYPIKVYKQRIIENYIADFYCHSARLVIEIDDAKEYDKRRTEIIGKYGIKVIRFTNKDVDEKFEGVCHMIDKTVKERIKALSVSSADSSPEGRA